MNSNCSIKVFNKENAEVVSITMEEDGAYIVAFDGFYPPVVCSRKRLIKLGFEKELEQLDRKVKLAKLLK